MAFQILAQIHRLDFENQAFSIRKTKYTFQNLKINISKNEINFYISKIKI